MVAQRQRGASRSASAQPSVRSHRRRACCSASDTPASSSICWVSSKVSASDGSRISVSWSRSRSLPSRSGGSARVAITTAGGRRAVQELIEVAVDRLGDLVEVVEHEHDGLVAPVQRRDQRRRQAVDPVLRVGGERRHGLAGARAVERLEDRAPEPPAVGVGGVEREPGDRPRRPAGRDPASQQHGLARTGRRRDQRQARRVPSSSSSCSRARTTVAGCSGGSANFGAGSASPLMRACRVAPPRRRGWTVSPSVLCLTPPE